MRLTFSFCRFWLSVVICISGLLLSPAQSQAQDHPKVIKIHVNPDIVLGYISPNFIGLGYETSSVARPNFFSADNTTMIHLYRNLSSHGLIRIGGIISDHTKYVPNGTSAPRTQENMTIINKTDLKNLGDFARATGWKVMWGINLQTSSKKKVVQEAVAVNKALGNHLQSFEIGNEVDLLSQFSSYDDYYQAYLAYKKAIRERLPNASFSGPDVAGNFNWLKKFAADEGNDIKLLTEHYYKGNGHDPESTVKKLLEPDSSWRVRLKKLRQVSQKAEVPYRINEVNSFYNGGKLGVSDTFASALWCLNYMFLLASYGSNGVNLETGINRHGWISHYSPIALNTSGRYTIRPEYYGMLAFAMAGNGKLLKLDMSKTDVSMSAYATKDGKKSLWITIINKDLTNDAAVHVILPKGYSKAHAFWLKAPSVKSKDHVTLAGTQVAADGAWAPGTPEKVVVNRGTAYLAVPHATAVLLRVIN